MLGRGGMREDCMERGIVLRRRTSHRVRSGLTAIFGTLGLALFSSLLVLTSPVFAAEFSLKRDDQIRSAQIARVLPAVVGILTEVRGTVKLRCGTGAVQTVEATPDRESGTGFLIHPDGWIATNGHVVLPVQKPEAEYATEFLEQVVKDTCGPTLQKLPANQRDARLKAIRTDPANRRGVTVTKRLEVFLPTGDPKDYYPAVVKASSPPIDPDLLPKGGGRPDPPMLDAALIKIEGANLPTVKLAQSIRTAVALGQQIFIAGYPGVVLWHPFLSQKARMDPSVTFGRVSAFRLDVNEREIIQTDAPISWGNSGGPAFDMAGEVIGLATFISTSLEGDESIQGFNFLIPIDTIQAMAEQLGLTPSTDSAFTRAWDQTVAAFIAGNYQEAITHAEAADQIVPGLSEVRRGIARMRALIGARP